MKNCFYFFVLITLSLCACKKGTGSFVLKGKVTDLTFNTGFEGAEMKIYKVPIGTTSELLIETVAIGEDGNYMISFPREKIEKYIIRIIKQNYFTIEQSIFYSELSLEEENVRNFSTEAKSWAAIRIINNPSVGSDHLRFIKQAGYQGCSECCPSEEQNYYGALDTTLYCVNKGNTLYSIYYWLVNTNTQGLKEVTTVAFDTTEIVLTY
jgi:hypothetical protein